MEAKIAKEIVAASYVFSVSVKIDQQLVAMLRTLVIQARNSWSCLNCFLIPPQLSIQRVIRPMPALWHSNSLNFLFFLEFLRWGFAVEVIRQKLRAVLVNRVLDLFYQNLFVVGWVVFLEMYLLAGWCLGPRRVVRSYQVDETRLSSAMLWFAYLHSHLTGRLNLDGLRGTFKIICSRSCKSGSTATWRHSKSLA